MSVTVDGESRKLEIDLYEMIDEHRYFGGLETGTIKMSLENMIQLEHPYFFTRMMSVREKDPLYIFLENLTDDHLRISEKTIDDLTYMKDIGTINATNTEEVESISGGATQKIVHVVSALYILSALRIYLSWP